MKTPSIFHVNGQTFLGTIKENTITGHTELDLGNYISEKALGNLTTIKVADLGTLYTEELKPSKVIEFERLVSLYKLAEKKSLKHITVQLFKDLAGKK